MVERDYIARSAYEAVVESLPFAVLLLDADLRIALANRFSATLFRTTRQRLRGVSITRLLPPRHLSGLLQPFDERNLRTIEITAAPRGRRRTPTTLRITAAHLTRRPASARGRLRDSTSRGAGQFTLLVLEDISNQTVLEQQLVQTEKQAAMAQLAAGILHEVANPLASINSNLLFARTNLAASAHPGVAQALDLSLEHVNQMRQTLGALSGFPHRVEPRYEIGDIQDVVRHCIAFISHETDRRRIRLSASFVASPILSEFDSRLVKQVLLNVLKNAMEAMPKGGRLDVRTSFRAPRKDEAAAAIIQIADTGVGITEADMRRVFRPLFSTKPSGTGLGLPFCRQVIEEHGGEIRLTSGGKDRGTVAVIVLPALSATGG